MNLEFLNEYLVLVVFGICLCVGYLIKTSVPVIPNKYIPLVVATLGVALNWWLNKFGFTPEVLLGGLFSGLASTGFHQALTKLIEQKE